LTDINVFDLVKPPAHPGFAHYRNADTFGFADIKWSDDGSSVSRVDLPIPDEVRTWMQAIKFAANNDTVLWAKPYVWELPAIRRRLASVRTMAVRLGLFVETKREWSEGRIYFHIVFNEKDLWTRRAAPET